MKKLIPFAILACTTCNDGGIDSDQPGCVTGDWIHDNKDVVVNIGCGTQAQYGNFALYRVDYKDLKWIPVNDCSECK